MIRVKAFALNRSELFTRQGHLPEVEFPRVLGMEAVGLVEDAPGGEFLKSATVVTAAMAGWGGRSTAGRTIHMRVATQAQGVQTELGWDLPGAIPVMLQTAWGSLLSHFVSTMASVC